MAITWTQKTNWASGYGKKCILNSDGSAVISCGAGSSGYYDLRKSTDNGANWSSVEPANFKQLSDIAGDSNFSHLVMGYQNTSDSYNGSFSTDSGTNWTDYYNGGVSAACDSDGSVMLIGTQYRCYYSTDTGANWTEFRPTGSNQNWKNVACDSDGSVMLAAYYTGKMYITINSGANWSEVQPAGATTKNWDNIICNSDGSIIYATVSAGRMYRSTDTGANWTEIRPSGEDGDGYYQISCSSDGQTVIVNRANSAATVKRTYYSTDAGDTWTETQPLGNVEAILYVAVSGDGTKFWVNNDASTAYSYYGVLSTTSVKSKNGLAKASIKSYNGLASPKSINGLS